MCAKLAMVFERRRLVSGNPQTRRRGSRATLCRSAAVRRSSPGDFQRRKTQRKADDLSPRFREVCGAACATAASAGVRASRSGGKMEALEPFSAPVRLRLSNELSNDWRRSGLPIWQQAGSAVWQGMVGTLQSGEQQADIASAAGVAMAAPVETASATATAQGIHRIRASNICIIHHTYYARAWP